MNKEKTNMQDYLHKLKFKDKIVLNQEDIKTSFTKIKGRIDLPNDVVLPPVLQVNLFTTTPFKIAASIVIILTLSVFGYNYYDNQKQITLVNNSEIVKQFILPDGTQVSLRNNSTLIYKKDYNKNRNIELAGEALFEVVKNKKNPFTVETETGKITVLGTIFSVRAFPDEDRTKTVLKEGSVEMQDKDNSMLVVLKPGEEALLSKGATEITVRKVQNMERQLAWQSHNFSFDNEALETILSVISDVYDKKVEIKDNDLAKKRFTLKFNRNESLNKMLEILSDVAKFNYKIDNNIIIVKNNRF